MVDEVYNKLNDQVWEIPTSNQYVSDSDSPLTLITSTMSSPILTSSDAIALSSMIPLFNDHQEKLKLSYPSRSNNNNNNNNNGTFYYSRSVEPSSTMNTTNYKELNNDNNQNVQVNYESIMCHENIIACNDTIACIKPQSVSIRWSVPGSNDGSSSIADTTAINSIEQEKDTYHSTSNSISSESSQETIIQTNYNNASSSIRIVIPNNNGENEIVNQFDIQHSSQQDYNSPSSYEDNSETSFTDIICNDRYQGTDGEPNLTETDTSKEESDVLDTPPPVENSKKRKRKHTTKYTSNMSTTVTTVTSNEVSSKKKKKSTTSSSSSSSSSSGETYNTKKSSQKKKRTITSYDAQTSQYLKSVFFEVYSKQNKLNKEQRAMVQEKTGLPSRNITYWFSNHKRRFQDTLQIYRKAVTDSKGSIKCYDDFVQWRKEHKLL